LGPGLNTGVKALAVSGSTLYAGGLFAYARNNTTVKFNGVAKWDGSSWSGLGSGMGGNAPYVLALAVSGNTLYAGGEFTKAGGTNANYIAQWDGTNWSSLGSGMGAMGGNTPRVLALAVSGTHFVCGRRVHYGWRHQRQLHRAMGRDQLVVAGFGSEQRQV